MLHRQPPIESSTTGPSTPDGAIPITKSPSLESMAIEPPSPEITPSHQSPTEHTAFIQKEVCQSPQSSSTLDNISIFAESDAP
ncbi:hypothetical protein OnM2_016060 [Erysiphe neolycopersici]|uniref:Uncharacterized protein n=1 Tax=Erysiphe neolycopersici TaxID=212602 RepID=A0A420I510_9PEZI|nr:hypothetical protein OnM2_016060 [Erysiphe neolycopersici]